MVPIDNKSINIGWNGFTPKQGWASRWTDNNPVHWYTYLTWDPLYQHGLTSIPAWISNYIHYKVGDEVTYPTVASLKFGNG